MAGAFGWRSREIDGHDFGQIVSALHACLFVDGVPSVILAYTVKGKGVVKMEDRLGWHYFSVSEEKLAGFVREVEEGR